MPSCWLIADGDWTCDGGERDDELPEAVDGFARVGDVEDRTAGWEKSILVKMFSAIVHELRSLGAEKFDLIVNNRSLRLFEDIVQLSEKKEISLTSTKTSN